MPIGQNPTHVVHPPITGCEIPLEAATIPCAVESYEFLDEIAGKVKIAGANLLRGGAFKPRTSPYSFQGLGEKGLQILREVGDKHGMPIVTEVMDPRQVDLISRYADMLQI